jgi:hypothetical protein
MLRSLKQVAESDNNEVLGFIASTVEAIRDRVGSIEENLKSIEQRMATKEDLAQLDGRLNERLSSLDGRLSERIEVAKTSIRGDIEQVQLRLDSMEHSIAARFESVRNQSPAQRCLRPRQRSS